MRKRRKKKRKPEKRRRKKRRLLKRRRPRNRPLNHSLRRRTNDSWRAPTKTRKKSRLLQLLLVRISRPENEPDDRRPRAQ